MKNTCSSRHCRPSLARQNGGLTLVELLVAIVLMLLVTLATTTLFSVNSASNRTVDASQELDDTARFSFYLIGQAIRNAGYASRIPVEVGGGTVQNLFANCQATASTTPCPVLGFDNSKVMTGTSTNFGSFNSGPAEINKSDSLAIRYYGASSPGAAVADGTALTCLGRKVSASTSDGELGQSIFWIRQSNGEPELICTHNLDNGNRDDGMVARGIESLQFMYGIDLCKTSAGAIDAAGCTRDGVPDRWVSASSVGSAANWSSVKAIRVGMVLRGAPGSSQVAQADTLYPLGMAFVNGLTENGLTFAAPADGRLRRTYVNTFFLRNAI